MPGGTVDAGYSHADDYRLTNAGYYEHLVRLFQGWRDHPEVGPAMARHARGGVRHRATVRLPAVGVRRPGARDYFIDVYAPAGAPATAPQLRGLHRRRPGVPHRVRRPHGRELQTVDYQPGRHDDGLMWGDYAMARIEPGNRVDRFLAGVAYLDGSRPSAVFARGYYTRSTLAAYDWDGRRLSQRWYVDSGWTPMSNPFNDSPHGRDGTDPEFGTLTTQGFHSLSAADVDGDGKHEIVYGAATIDHDGDLLYSSFADCRKEAPPRGRQPDWVTATPCT